MTKTGRTLGEYIDMGAAGTVALCHFLTSLDLDARTAYETAELDAAEWSDTLKTNALLADIYDAIRLFNYSFAGKKAKEPKPYPRPWAENKSQKYGKDAIPILDFEDWWNKEDKCLEE